MLAQICIHKKLIDIGKLKLSFNLLCINLKYVFHLQNYSEIFFFASHKRCCQSSILTVGRSIESNNRDFIQDKVSIL